MLYYELGQNFNVQGTNTWKVGVVGVMEFDSSFSVVILASGRIS